MQATTIPTFTRNARVIWTRTRRPGQTYDLPATVLRVNWDGALLVLVSKHDLSDPRDERRDAGQWFVTDLASVRPA
jgi:hypothetical protein